MKTAKQRFSLAAKAANQRMREQTHQRDEEGRVILHMTVENDEGFLSAFSESGDPVISTDVADFLEETTHAVLPREPLTLRIHSQCIDDKEKELYRRAIKEFYTQRYIANQRELRRHLLAVFALAILGVGMLAFRIIFEACYANEIGIEVMDIIAWVFLWEAVDVGAFQSRLMRLKRQRYLAFLDMRVEYSQS